MNIQIRTNKNLGVDEEIAPQVEHEIKRILSRLTERINRVEVYIIDENDENNGSPGKRCLMEARLEGQQAIAVAHEAETINDVVRGASDKLKSSLNYTLGRTGRS